MGRKAKMGLPTRHVIAARIESMVGSDRRQTNTTVAR